MAILAEIPHKYSNMTVEVTDVYTTSNGVKMARIAALKGRPFCEYTSGGWCESNTARFPADLLRNVRTAQG